jgi:dTDP-4-dehydrorhamnose reductase
MKILIVGASSYVGARIYLDLSKKHEVIGTYHQNKLSDQFMQLDILVQKACLNLIQKIRPEIIVHLANNASSKWCEANPEAALLLNQKSSEFIVEAANSISARLIYISSYAAIAPENTYGKTKLASENIIKNTRAGYLSLRPSLIIGLSPNTTNDRPFNRFLKNLDEKTPAVYDTSWKFQPSYLGHLSEVIETCIAKDIWNQTLPVAVPELKSRYDLAKDILRPFGVEVTAIDNHDNSKVATCDLSILSELNLPNYNYQEIIQKIVAEIKKRGEVSL